MIKPISYFASTCLSIMMIPGICLAKTHPNHVKHPQEKTQKSSKKNLPPQVEIYEAHKGSNQNYVLALYTNQQGPALISYNSPSCQADSHGTTALNPKNISEIIFTAKKDPYCQITLKKTNDKTIEVTKETLACNAWQGDFCSFKTLPILHRIYPQPLSGNHNE